MNATKTAAIFGCSPQQAEVQMRKNLAGLQSMEAKARSTGRKVNGYTADDLAGMIAKVKKGWNL
jgi:hypothetical protein